MVDQMLEDMRPVACLILKESLNNLIKITKKNPIPQVGGHYVILSSRDISNRGAYKYKDLYVLYNGKSETTLRSRINEHLYRKSYWVSKGALGIRKERTEVIKKNCSSYRDHTFSPVSGEPGYRWLNGINHNDYNCDFYIAYIETRELNSYFEKLFRDEYGIPICCGNITS